LVKAIEDRAAKDPSAHHKAVIPTEVEGPAVLLIRVSDVEEIAALPFVIPSEVEGSAVQRTSPGNVFDKA
jgi:hypothetical protein